MKSLIMKLIIPCIQVYAVLLCTTSVCKGFDLGGLNALLKRGSASVQNGRLYHRYTPEHIPNKRTAPSNLSLQNMAQTMQQTSMGHRTSSRSAPQPMSQLRSLPSGMMYQGSLQHDQNSIGKPNSIQPSPLQYGLRQDQMQSGPLKSSMTAGMIPGMTQRMTSSPTQGIAQSIATGVGIVPGMNAAAGQVAPGMAAGLAGMAAGMSSGMKQGMSVGLTPGTIPNIDPSQTSGASMVSGLTPGMVAGMTSGISAGTMQGIPQGIPPGIPQGLPQGMPQGMPSGMPQGMQQGIPQSMQQEIQQGIQNGIPQNMQQGNNPSSAMMYGAMQGAMQPPTQQNGMMPTAQFSPMLRALGDFKFNLIEQHKDALEGIRRAQLKQIIETQKAEKSAKEGKMKKKFRRKKARMSRSRSKNRRRYQVPMHNMEHQQPLASASKKVMFVDDFLKHKAVPGGKSNINEITTQKAVKQELSDVKGGTNTTTEANEDKSVEDLIMAIQPIRNEENRTKDEANHKLEIIHEPLEHDSSNLTNPNPTAATTEDVHAIFSAFMGKKYNSKLSYHEKPSLESIHLNPEKLTMRNDDLVMSNSNQKLMYSNTTNKDYIPKASNNNTKGFIRIPRSDVTDKDKSDLPLWGIMAYLLNLNESSTNASTNSSAEKKNITSTALPKMPNNNKIPKKPFLIPGRVDIKNKTRTRIETTKPDAKNTSYERVTPRTHTPNKLKESTNTSSQGVKYSTNETLSRRHNTTSSGLNMTNKHSVKSKSINDTDLTMQGSYILKSYIHNIIPNNSGKLNKNVAKSNEYLGNQINTSSTTRPTLSSIPDEKTNKSRNSKTPRSKLDNETGATKNNQKLNRGFFYDVSHPPEDVMKMDRDNSHESTDSDDYEHTEEFIIEILESSTQPAPTEMSNISEKDFNEDLIFRTISNQDRLYAMEPSARNNTNRVNKSSTAIPSNRARTLTTETDAKVMKTRFEDDKIFDIEPNTIVPPAIDPNNVMGDYTRSDFDETGIYPLRADEGDSEEIPCSNNVNLDQKERPNPITLAQYQTNMALSNMTIPFTKSKDDTFSMLTNEDMYNAGMKDPKYAPFYNDYQLIQVIPKVINELKSQELSDEKLKAYEVKFGDLWPLMLNESYKDNEDEDVSPSISTILNTEMYITKINKLQHKRSIESKDVLYSEGDEPHATSFEYARDDNKNTMIKSTFEYGDFTGEPEDVQKKVSNITFMRRLLLDTLYKEDTTVSEVKVNKDYNMANLSYLEDRLKVLPLVVTINNYDQPIDTNKNEDEIIDESEHFLPFETKTEELSLGAIRKVVDELKTQKLSEEKLKSYELQFGDLWPLIINKSYEKAEQRYPSPLITILNTSVHTEHNYYPGQKSLSETYSSKSESNQLRTYPFYNKEIKYDKLIHMENTDEQHSQELSKRSNLSPIIFWTTNPFLEEFDNDDIGKENSKSIPNADDVDIRIPKVNYKSYYDSENEDYLRVLPLIINGDGIQEIDEYEKFQHMLRAGKKDGK